MKNKLQSHTVKKQQFADKAKKCEDRGYLKSVKNKNKVNQFDARVYKLTNKGEEFLNENAQQVQEYGDYLIEDLFSEQVLNPVEAIIRENEQLVANLKAIRIQLLKSLMVESDNG